VHDAADHRLARAVARLAQDVDVVRAHEPVGQAADRAEELHDEAVRRSVVELARRPDLLDPPAVEHRDPVRDRHRLLLVVRDQHGRDVDLVVQAAQPLAQLGAHLGVERAERLVEQQHARLDGERARQRHPLALAARELIRVALRVAAEADDAEQLGDPGVDARPRLLADLQPERDVVVHGHVLERRVVLEDEADLPALRRHARGVVALDLDAAGVGRLEAGDDPQQARLARAARAEQRGQRAAGDLERDVVERDEVAEALGDLADRDHAFLLGLTTVINSNVANAISASSADAA
jgi:hypothetical protein